VSPDRLQENKLIGLESNGQFELHEVITKIIDNNRPSMVVCRRFVQPENIKTLSFWSDLDKPIFIPEKAFSISDFVYIKNNDSPESAATGPRQADISALCLSSNYAKNVAFYGEKQMKSGKIKFTLILKTSKNQWSKYTAMSGKTSWPSPISSEYRLNSQIKLLVRQGYEQKTP
jgi:hypothetical protein